MIVHLARPIGLVHTMHSALLDCLVGMLGFSFHSKWHHSPGKAPYGLYPTSQQSPQGCSQKGTNGGLVEHRSLLTSEVGMLAPSFLHPFFLLVISAVMLWSVWVQKVPQASQHLCFGRQLTSCDICSACPVSLSARSFPLTGAWTG